LRDDLADLAEGFEGRSNAVFQVKQSRIAPTLGRGDFIPACRISLENRGKQFAPSVRLDRV
jgi:hypothetical protein